MKEPMMDSTATATLVVTRDDLASARVLQPWLGDGELSVGVGVEVTHTAPTPEGARITATARYVGRDGKRFVFEVRAADAGGEIGRARHQRAIVNGQRLETSARRRIDVGLSA